MLLHQFTSAASWEYTNSVPEILQTELNQNRLRHFRRALYRATSRHKELQSHISINPLPFASVKRLICGFIPLLPITTKDSYKWR